MCSHWIIYLYYFRITLTIQKVINTNRFQVQRLIIIGCTGNCFFLLLSLTIFINIILTNYTQAFRHILWELPKFRLEWDCICIVIFIGFYGIQFIDSHASIESYYYEKVDDLMSHKLVFLLLLIFLYVITHIYFSPAYKIWVMVYGL